MPQEIQEAGARNSASDKKIIQDLHESAVKLGADCPGMSESIREENETEAGAVHLRESAAVDLADYTLQPIAEAAAAAIKSIKLIQPGWGSSGYYSAEMLKRDGPKAFPQNTHMYWDHQTETQEAERPEGSMDNLAAVTVSPTTWMDNGPAGAGLYAECKIFSDYAAKVDEKAPYTGLSIRALGQAKEGIAEGRKGPIIESLLIGKSVDFVTKAGAGGQVLIESARPAGQQHSSTTSTTTAAESSRNPNSGAVDMTDQEIQSLREAAATEKARADKLEQRLARAEGRSLVSEARGFIAEKLQTAELPDVTKKLITNRECVNPPAKEDGTLDTAKFAAQIEEAVKAEAAYLSQVQGSGQVRNLGAAAGTVPAQVDEAKLDELIENEFAAMGLSESARKIAAKGRV